MGACAVEEKGYHVTGRMAARYLLPAYERGVAEVNMLKKMQFFNILLKICIFAFETSDA